MLQIREIAEELSRLVVANLQLYEVPYEVFSETEQFSKGEGRYQHTHLMPYRTKDRVLTLDEFSRQILRPIAMTFGITLVRRLPVVFYLQETPTNTYECWQVIDDVPLRAITDYCVSSKDERFDDAIITRFDILNSWKE